MTKKPRKGPKQGNQRRSQTPNTAKGNPSWKRTSANKIAEMMSAFRPIFKEILQTHRELTKESKKTVLVIIGPHPPATRIPFLPKLSLIPEKATEALRTLGAPRYVIEQYLSELLERHGTDEKWRAEQRDRLSLPLRGHLWGERNSAALLAALAYEAGFMFPDISDLAFAKMVNGLANPNDPKGKTAKGQSVNTLRSFLSKWRLMSEEEQNEILLRGEFVGVEYP